MQEAKTKPPAFDLESLILAHGAHKKRSEGACLMEAVAWFAGEKHSDRPQCTDVALGAYGRNLNDRLRDDERQLLKPLIPMLVGTKGSPELARRRAYFLVDRHVRVNLPAFLRELPAKPRPEMAARLEGLPPVIDAESAEQARVLARELRDALWSEPRSYAADAAAAAAAADAAYAAAADAAAAAAADAADAAYAAAYADAAAAAAAYADAAAAYADAAQKLRDDFAALRRRTIGRSIGSFRAAIALTEES